MDFEYSQRSQALQEQVRQFLDEHVYPAEHDFEREVAENRAKGDPFRTPAVLGGLKQTARQHGLWNLFLPDDKYGEEICAWIRMKPGRQALDAAALREFASDRLAHYKIPRYVHVVDEFPMTVTGKVRKVDMRKDSIELLGLDPT